jgi:hypothetical protein
VSLVLELPVLPSTRETIGVSYSPADLIPAHMRNRQSSTLAILPLPLRPTQIQAAPPSFPPFPGTCVSSVDYAGDLLKHYKQSK